jgi:hypothetical protein
VSTATTDRVRRTADQLTAALGYPLSSERRAAGALAVAAVTYVVLVLSTFPRMSVQMLAAGVAWLDDAVVLLTKNTLATVGYGGFALLVAYALLTGVAVTNAVASVRLDGVSNVRDLTGVLPGLLASGCASCGAGVLGLLGLAGALAAMPFHGDLLRLGGVVLLLGFLARAGHPERCRLN